VHCEVLFCSVVHFNNAYAEIGPMLISGNVSFLNMLLLCGKTNDNYVFQFLMSNF
jgi:hypothetical protein